VWQKDATGNADCLKILDQDWNPGWNEKRKDCLRIETDKVKNISPER